MLHSIFKDIPDQQPDELVEILASSDSVRIERIVSYGQSSKPDFWYQQEQSEFVILLSGNAMLEFDGGEIITMLPGDYINIPARQRHRVLATATDEKSVWLCVFY